jgi:hypothetical protein
MLGYYRVNYDEQSWQMIINDLKNTLFYTNIPTLNRAQLLDDSFNLAKAGYLNFNTTMNLLSYLSHEVELPPLIAGFRTIEFLIEFLDEQNFYQELRDRMLEIVEKIYVNIRDSTNDLNSEEKRLLRLHVNFFACKIGVKACLDDVSKSIFLFNIEYSKLDIDKRPYLYCGALNTELSSYYWTEMKKKIVKANEYNDHIYRSNQEEFNEIFSAFSLCDRDLNRMERLLTDIFIANPYNTLNDDLARYDNVSSDNAFEVISNLIKTSYEGRTLVMKFYKDHFDAVNEK